MSNELSFPLKKLWFTHVFIIVLSNYAVQIPLTLFGFHTTWGTFTYPFIFLTTDLTVRIFGQKRARKIIFSATLPGLVLSYLVVCLFQNGVYCGMESLINFSIFSFRITFASLSAYLLGQLMDIFVFQKLREKKAWWVAPTMSSVFGNLIDTFVFFSLAFYASSNPFMAAHWFELSVFDYAAKIAANLSVFVPIYGIVLSVLSRFVGLDLNRARA